MISFDTPTSLNGAELLNELDAELFSIETCGSTWWEEMFTNRNHFRSDHVDRIMNSLFKRKIFS